MWSKSRTVNVSLPPKCGIINYWSQRSFSPLTVNILRKQDEFKCLSQFLGCDDEPVKKQWPILRRYQIECNINPTIHINRLEWINQRYGMIQWSYCCIACIFKKKK